ncbi:MAG: type I phosphomannose isomerase catalytic subunit [Vulcanimicrobiaceae bacterium]
MTQSTIYPYAIEPKETPAIWGGDALVRHYGKNADPNAKIGESWECWDSNPVVNGPLAGKSIADLRAQLGASLLGDIDPAGMFPVLTKIIDARDWLSVQVHPNDAYAQRVEHQPNGKTECWYIFSAEPDSELVLGWTRDTSRAEYERRVADGSLGDILRHVPVKAGDTFYLPSGTLHAVGKGIILFETQQASDLTYRIFDWNRTGPDGKPRELAVKKAGDVLDYHRGTGGALDQIAYHFDGLDRTAMIAGPNFVVERVVASDEPASLPTNGRPLILMSLGQPLEVRGNDIALQLGKYHTALVPAALEWCTVRAIDGAAPFMFVTPPADRAALPVRLLAAGIAQSRVDAFMAQFPA